MHVKYVLRSSEFLWHVFQPENLLSIHFSCSTLDPHRTETCSEKYRQPFEPLQTLEVFCCLSFLLNQKVTSHGLVGVLFDEESIAIGNYVNLSVAAGCVRVFGHLQQWGMNWLEFFSIWSRPEFRIV